MGGVLTGGDELRATGNYQVSTEIRSKILYNLTRLIHFV